MTRPNASDECKVCAARALAMAENRWHVGFRWCPHCGARWCWS